MIPNNKKNKIKKVVFLNLLVLFSVLIAFSLSSSKENTIDLKEAFKNPPDSAKPGVYWYFMDGNLSRKEMTNDLESMKNAGITNLIFLEVGIGVPRGSVDFMSEEWQELFVHAVREAEQLGIKILMGAGPGWCGSGGPWIEPEESMQHLVFNETKILGGDKIKIELPIPEQRSTPWHNTKDPYYKDVAVYAIPTNAEPTIEDINEKALYERYPYTSHPNVKTHLPALSEYIDVDSGKFLDHDEIIDISPFMNSDGLLDWNAPQGDWTIVRMGARITGASSRPAPEPGIGLESNKLDSLAFKKHLANYTDILLQKTSPRKKNVGWTGFHMDSWESGSQNWTKELVSEFKKRRGYNPEPFFLTYTGRAVESLEISERFLWDLRRTCQELVLENHAEFAKKYAHRNGLELTIEPYDMNPAGDLDLGAVADVIMAEFWNKNFGFDSHYAVIEASSIAHITGQSVIGAEVFTSENNQAWQEYPWSMKDQSDWALAHGINRFVYHTFAHKPLGDDYRPGMTMGQYGVHWDRGQTWWPMVNAYHEYISRSSHLMQQGQAVSDILYLTPEGAPMIFKAPEDALEKNGTIPDKKEYGFDGCSPLMLLERADVENGKIIFPGATSYEIMVLPNFKTMTPELLEKIIFLVEKGAKIIGNPPIKSPSLTNYPKCDEKVKALSQKLWGSLNAPESLSERKYGKGRIFWGGELTNSNTSDLYPDYIHTAQLLSEIGVDKDFHSSNNTIRYGHRRTANRDIYFVANRTEHFQSTECTFRAKGEPELWIATTGETRKLKDYKIEKGNTIIPMEFFPYESFFIVFSNEKNKHDSSQKHKENFSVFNEVKTLDGPWNVSFDPKWGGPESIKFDSLQDWTQHEMRGIKFYSGIAKYTKDFTYKESKNKSKRTFLDLGEVNDIARVILNGKEVGVVWCAPWRIDISEALTEGMNSLEIEVANRWINRLVGDREEPDASVRTVKFEDGLLEGKEYTTGRYTFTTEIAMRSFNFTEPLSSGLLGPVTIQEVTLN